MSKKTAEKKREPKGKIHSEHTLFLRQDVGSATDGEDRKYDLTVSVSDMSPIVESGQTKKYFTLSWEDIIKLAIEKGINEPR